MTARRVALIGGRGYTGGELLRILARHPRLELALASSTSRAGAPLRETCPDWPDPEARLVALEPASVGDHAADAWVLAVPNGAAAEWAAAIGQAHPEAVVLDLSADHRFDDAWVYGLTERHREAIRGARRIANPGCYATGMQLALWPLLDQLEGVPVVFGVSGHSGAGRAPSPRNDPERLRDNLVPYALHDHVHEREVTHHLGCEVRFAPHVASFFRGISLTVTAGLSAPMDAGGLLERFRAAYGDEPRVRVQRGIPEVAQAQGTHDLLIGGFSADPRDRRRITLVAVLDNLLKGAASQAVQNLNLALGLDEHEGLGP